MNQAHKGVQQQERDRPGIEVVRRITSKIATLLLRASKWYFLRSHKRGCIKNKMLRSNY